jgi:predicted CXXCH cytochrome family protein
MKMLTTVIRGLLTNVLIIVGLESGSVAFHDGGVAVCVGCHTIHGSNIFSISGPSLLREQDASSTCLFCHQQAGDSGPTDYHASTPFNELPQGIPPKQLTPGGDFGRRNFLFLRILIATNAASGSIHDGVHR